MASCSFIASISRFDAKEHKRSHWGKGSWQPPKVPRQVEENALILGVNLVDLKSISKKKLKISEVKENH